MGNDGGLDKGQRGQCWLVSDVSSNCGPCRTENLIRSSNQINGSATYIIQVPEQTFANRFGAETRKQDLLSLSKRRTVEARTMYDCKRVIYALCGKVKNLRQSICRWDTRDVMPIGCLDYYRLAVIGYASFVSRGFHQLNPKHTHTPRTKDQIADEKPLKREVGWIGCFSCMN